MNVVKEMERKNWFILSCLFVAGCASSVTVPVMVVTNDGRTLRGTATTTYTEGSFSAKDGSLLCNGKFDPSSGSKTVSLAVTCSDGRSGVGTAYRDTLAAGNGEIAMNDGTRARFVFGSAAR